MTVDILLRVPAPAADAARSSVTGAVAVAGQLHDGALLAWAHGAFIHGMSLVLPVCGAFAVAALIAERTGRGGDDLDVHCAAAAIIAVSTAVVRHWVEGDGTQDLVALYDRQFAALAGGLRF